MPLTIAVVQLKGGTGRSTLATNLAGALATLPGASAVLVDGDLPQGTSSAWFAAREKLWVGQYGAEVWARLNRITLAPVANHRELTAQVRRHADASFVVLDAPPRTAEMTRAMLLLADVVLVPCGPSLPELWATQDLLPVLEDVPHKPVVRLVWTRVRGGVGLSDELTGTAAKQLGITPLKTRLALRVTYAECLGDGQTVAEAGNRAAREELTALVREVRRLV